MSIDELQPGTPVRDQVGLRCIVIAVTRRAVYWRSTHAGIRTVGCMPRERFTKLFTLDRTGTDGNR